MVVGITRSSDFPTTPGAYRTTHSGGTDADAYDVFVTVLAEEGTALVGSTYVGGKRACWGCSLMGILKRNARPTEMGCITSGPAARAKQ